RVFCSAARERLLEECLEVGDRLAVRARVVAHRRAARHARRSAAELLARFIDECPIRLLPDLASRRVHDVGGAPPRGTERYVESMKRSLVLHDRDILARHATAR